VTNDDLAYFDRKFDSLSTAFQHQFEELSKRCEERGRACGLRFADLEGNNKVFKTLECQRQEEKRAAPHLAKVRSNWALVAVTVLIMINAIMEIVRWYR